MRVSVRPVDLVLKVSHPAKIVRLIEDAHDRRLQLFGPLAHSFIRRSPASSRALAPAHSQEKVRSGGADPFLVFMVGCAVNLRAPPAL